jgi:CDP-6-deoxy-D-xylo-4-hexulose-3-dehydrase
MTDHCITDEDRDSMMEFVELASIFTQSSKCKEFEEEWSKWQGCKYSVFVNSGSSANLLLVSAISALYGRGSWICQSTTWSTNVSPIIQLNMPLRLCDISLNNLGPDLCHLGRILETGNYKYLFITHLLGFNALTSSLLELCKKHNIILIEDCCESHGAVFDGKRVGGTGVGSTFSFYYGHHMTTIEGGMVCTDDTSIYHLLLLMRSHGLLRELPADERERQKLIDIDPRFTFLCTGYNLRSHEINAVLGIRQLKDLDRNIDIRNRNVRCFFKNVDKSKYKTDFASYGMSSFCLPIVSITRNIDSVKNLLDETAIEWRPIVAGNLSRHPIVSNQRNEFPNSDFLHYNGVYVGNHQGVTEEMVYDLCNKLNDLR